MDIKIIKRDGREKKYEGNRIISAVDKAVFDAYPKRQSTNIGYEIEQLVEQYLTEKNITTITVEHLQDVILSELRIKDKKIYKSYKDYREQRNIVRQQTTDSYNKISSILKCKNVLNSNANVDEHSFGGRKFESAGIVMKDYALYTILPKEFRDAHLNNEVYQHDLDSYAIGEHNCSFIDARPIINENGFTTRNGDVRAAQSVSTGFQQLAVTFQIQSQEQFGGTASAHIDYDLEPLVNISFRKHFQVGLNLYNRLNSSDKEEIFNINDMNSKVDFKVNLPDFVNIENYEKLKDFYPIKVINYALEELDKEGNQAAQGLFHNLNTLESRPGSQVPFTSINFGRVTSIAGRLIAKWLLNASLEGIGKFNRTSIFPISIFQYKKGVNAKPEDPNYDEKLKMIESLSHRIYPNIVNGDWSQNVDDPSNPDTWMATMGCRTLVGFDQNGMGYIKVGRGNVAPATINLIKIGILHGICLGKRQQPDIKGFWEHLDRTIDLTIRSLKFRFDYICSQSSYSAPFMYKNKTMRGGEYGDKNCVYDVMKHGTLGIGYIGIAEMCQAMFGKDHADGDKDVYDFALNVVKRISDKAKEASKKYGLNFGCYASPAESTCGTVITGNREIKGLRDEFGIIPNVTSNDFATNSHHVPVWKHVDIFTKLKLEAPFTKYATSGCITYVELDSGIMKNPKAIEQIIDYAMDLDIPYLAFNFPIDTCLDCGFQGEFNDHCTKCGSKNIEQLRRVTGYLSTDYHKFNHAKQEETKLRFKHSTITEFNLEETECQTL